MQIHFIRHGQSEANLLHEFSNRPGKHPLTALGEKQARTLAENMRDAGVIQVYSSPILRALQTAGFIAEAAGCPLQVTETLKEFDVGNLEGSQAAEDWEAYFKLCDAWLHQRKWDQSLGGGETYYALRDRFVPFVENLVDASRHEPGILALVGHGGTYRCMLPLILSNISFQFAREAPLHNTTRVITELRGSRLYCLQWGELTPPDAA